MATMLIGALTIAFGIRSHQGHGHLPMGGVDQRAPRGTIVGRTVLRRLREDQAAVDIHGHRPCEPVAPGEPQFPILGTPDGERADRPRREAFRVYCPCRLVAGLGYQPLYNSIHHRLQDRLSEPAEEPVHGV
jgi:hypothetical protein